MLYRTILKVPIEYLTTDEANIPVFLPLVCGLIVQNSKEVGIFRINGDKSRIHNLNVSLAQHQSTIPDDTTVHDTAHFMKDWLRLLPDPLIDPNVINRYFNDDYDQYTVDILRNMPEPNRKSLCCIFTMTREILREQEYNRMDFPNMHLCFFRILIKESHGIEVPLNFLKFYQKSVSLINDRKSDFDLP